MQLESKKRFSRRVSYAVGPQQKALQIVAALGLVYPRGLSQQLGLSVIVVLHDINMAARYCDRLIALHSGRLLLDGSPAELMTDSNLEAIYGLPMQVLSHPQGQQPIAVVV